MSITAMQAQNALTVWNIAGNYLSALALSADKDEGREWYSERFWQNLSDALSALGYTLTPIVTPSPDSGRAKEIGDVFQNHGA